MNSVVHIMTVPFFLRFFIGQAKYLEAHGIKFEVLCSPGFELQEFVESENIQAYPVSIKRSISPINDLVSLINIWRTLRKTQPTIVHCHTPKGGLLGLLGAFLARVPIRIYHIHGLRYATESGLKRRLLKTIERISCLLAHQAYSVSHSLRDEIIREGLCSEKKIKVLHNGSINGIDSKKIFNPDLCQEDAQAIREKYNIGKTDILLGFVGRVVKDKGISELIQAWEVLKNDNKNLHLLIVGPVEENNVVPENILKIIENDPRIHTTGLVSNLKDIPAYYAAMDIVVFPTHREGFGLAALEAAAMQIPIVATKIPGVIDAVLDGVTGSLVPVQNAPALASAIKRYLENSNLRLEHGQSGRERAIQDFQPEDIWNALIEEYKHLLSTYT